MEDPTEENEFEHCVESVVKITVSPNTPSPEPEDDENSETLETGCDTEGNDSSSSCIENDISHPVDLDEKFPRTFCTPGNEVPTCIDFGIQDYLCRVQQETEFDLSSDTDTSYLGATPPHRFSDGEIDPIEAMPVLLDTKLNLTQDSLTSICKDDPTSPIFSMSCSWKDPGVQRLLGKSASKESLLSLFNSAQNSSNTYNHFKTIKLQERSYPRPFKRNISLPATIFKSFLIENVDTSQVNSKTFRDSQTSLTPSGEESSTFTRKGLTHLSKIDSISNSSQTDLQLDSSFEQDKLCSSLTPSSERISGGSLGSNWDICTPGDLEQEDLENQPFTSDVEKRSLIIRHMRRLIRQDTTGNFAPPDYHI